MLVNIDSIINLLPPGEREEVEEKTALIEERLLERVVDFLPEEKARELADLLESGQNDEGGKFLIDNVPELFDWLQAEVRKVLN